MRDPDLMQRADRAAIALEQAWERWRAMHGLGAEPLPPVSSYVGYSLEEPWGQPRVVFGLRADEAELLASLFDGHECAGSIYPELDTRLPLRGPVSMPARGYGGPLSVPAQAPPPGMDLLPPGPVDGFARGGPADEEATAADDPADDSGPPEAIRRVSGPGSARGRAARTPRPDRAVRRTAEPVADAVDATPERDDTGWSAADGETRQADLDAAAGSAAIGVPESPRLAPLPDAPDLRPGADEAAADESDLPGAVAPHSAATANGSTRGPGYRGQRYQGFPPRYDSGHSAAQSSARSTGAAEDDGNADVGAEPRSARTTHVAKLSRSARRRAQGG
jgi:hypothetical protein